MAAKRPTAAQVAQESRLTAIRELLRTCRERGDYPLTVERIAAELQLPPADTLKLLARPSQPPAFLLAAKSVAAPVVLSEDFPTLVESPALLVFAAANVDGRRQKKGAPQRGDVKKFTSDAGLDKALSQPFAATIERRREAGALPPEVANLLALPPAEIARQLLTTLESQHRDLPASCPVPQRRLLALANCDLKQAGVKQSLKEPAFVDHVVPCVDAPAKEPAYMLRAGMTALLPTLALRGVEQAFVAQAQKAAGAAAKTTLFAARDIAAAITKSKPLQGELADGIEQCADRQGLAAELGWLYEKGKRRFFRRRDIEPAGSSHEARGESAPPPAPRASALETGQAAPADFASAFDAAFARVDARAGGRNFVKVYDLRQELPLIARTAFDAGLRTLRIADRYTMESAHGGAVRLTADELQAGIQEGSSLLVYVSRK